MLCYRITHKKYSAYLYASGMEGRWNRSGNKVIYCAESIALAFLENMVRRQGVGFNKDFKIMIIEVLDTLPMTVIKHENLNPAWRNIHNYLLCQQVGNDWFDTCLTPVLKVPSAILPENYNYVINSEHPGFKKIKLIETVDLVPDERIEDILKKYRKK